jgi:hypothetical protein
MPEKVEQSDKAAAAAHQEATKHQQKSVNSLNTSFGGVCGGTYVAEHTWWATSGSSCEQNQGRPADQRMGPQSNEQYEVRWRWTQTHGHSDLFTARLLMTLFRDICVQSPAARSAINPLAVVKQKRYNEVPGLL